MTTSISKQGVVGSMSGWEVYSTDQPNSVAANIQEKYTIPELLTMIKSIKINFDPKVLERFLLLVEDHIHDQNNPHNLTLETLGTSVLAELYEEWQNEGYTGTLDDFKKVLFQYIRIADIATTLEGTSETQVVSVAGSKAVYEDHLVDINAHNEMWRTIFPGTNIDTVPSLSIQAFIGVPNNLVVSRPSTCIYHTPTGYFEEAPINTIPIDHLYKHPAFSIWGERTNFILYSENLASGNILGGEASAIVNSLTPNKDTKAIVITESEGTTIEHGWESIAISFVQGKTYTVSMYVLPMEREYFGFSIPINLTGCTRLPVYSLTEEDTTFLPLGYIESVNNAGEAIILDNEWVKITHTFVAQSSMSANIKGLFVDIIDGDMTYIGTGVKAGALYQAQLEEGVNASPPIFTEQYPVTRPKTIVTIPFVDVFNERSGTLSITAKKPPAVIGNRSQYLYELGDTTESTLNGLYQVATLNQLLMTSYSQTLEILDQQLTGDADRDLTTFVHAYDIYHHRYSNTGNLSIEHDISDASVSFANALDYLLSEVYGSPGVQNSEVVQVDFSANLVNSTTNISNLTDVEVLTYTITTLYNKVITQKNDNDLAIVDYLESGELTDLSRLNDNGNILFIGCDRNGENQLDGYIFDITYYPTYATELETEFLTGEYVNGE